MVNAGDLSHAQIVQGLLSTAGEMDNMLTEQSPMATEQLIAGHTNMHSTLMAAQIHATLMLTGQVKRIADALEERAA